MWTVVPNRKVNISRWIEEVVSFIVYFAELSAPSTDKLIYHLHLQNDSGKGKWKEIATMIPTRSTVQVKTHAQMVMKRMEAGEDVFEDLQEFKTEEQTIQTPDKVASQHPVYMNRASCHQAIDSLQEYGALNLMDQGAVMILYQMAKAM